MDRIKVMEEKFVLVVEGKRILLERALNSVC